MTERQSKIIKLVNQYQKIEVSRLAEMLDVSQVTIRKDLDYLEEEGFVVTVHGKGSYISGTNQSLLLEERRRETEQELEQVIRKARAGGLTDQELKELFELIMEESL